MAVFRGEELIFRRERCCETGVATVDPGELGPGQLLVEARYTLVSQGTELAWPRSACRAASAAGITGQSPPGSSGSTRGRG